VRNSELTFLQSLTEAELHELILMPLLSRMGYRNVRSLHGPQEYGKDIVFDHHDPLSRVRHYGLVVKRGPLSGSVSSSTSLRTTRFQIIQALDTPFFDLDGKEIMLDGVYLVTAHPVSQQALASVSGAMRETRHAFRLIDGPALIDLIRQYHPDLTWSLPHGLPKISTKVDVQAQPRSKMAFVLMPFGGHYDAYYPSVYKPGLETAGFIVQRADDIYTPQPIIKDIQELIVRADLILCDMSGRNPNVFYELGLAHAIGRPVILVCDNLNDVPFDLRHIRVIAYDCKMPDWAPKLRDAIRAAAQSLEDEELWPPPLLSKAKGEW
jgi:hypothetical protein